MSIPCDHLDPREIIDLAEAYLREHRSSPQPGMRFRHGENLQEGAKWASVVIEIERRGGEWIVTRFDRSPDRLPESDTGLQVA